jgi:hypothetical protein
MCASKQNIAITTIYTPFWPCVATPLLQLSLILTKALLYKYRTIRSKKIQQRATSPSRFIQQG